MKQSDVDQSLDKIENKSIDEIPIPISVHVYLFLTAFFISLFLIIAFVSLLSWNDRFIVFTLFFTLFSLLAFWFVSQGYRTAALIQIIIIALLALSNEPKLGFFVIILIGLNIFITGITFISTEANRYYASHERSPLVYKLIFYIYSFLCSIIIIQNIEI